MSFRPCPACKGARLKPEVLAVTVGGLNIHEFTQMSVTRALAFLDELELTEVEQLIGARIVKEIRERLTFLDDVGVGYLKLDRASATLSGGEAQRLRLATQIGSQLVGVLYILDEPSIGLHQRDNGRLIGTLERLRDLGNTVVVVEHDEQMMRSADWLVDMGPGAGEHGGHVVAEGPAGEGRRGTAKLGHRAVPLRARARSRCPSGAPTTAGSFWVRGAAQHNLKEIDVEFPVAKLVCVTGVSGSGKSTLVNEIVYKALANRLNRLRVEAGRARGGRGHRVLRQGDRHRPVADRPHAALEPGDLHRPLHADPRALLAHARGEGARLQAGPLLVQRPRRPLRDLQGRRADQDRDALPPRRLRAVRDLQGRALQPRDARGALQGQEDRRRARDVGRGGARSSSPRSRRSAASCRRCTTSGSTTSSSASRRRRSRAARRSG